MIIIKTIITIVLLVSVIGCANTAYRAEQVRERLYASENLAAHNISIDEQRPGIITLNGHVASESDREMIERITRNTRGVDRVNSNLVVDSSSVEIRDGTSPNPHFISATMSEIKNKIASSSTLNNYNINIDLIGDTVVMQGEVGNENELAEAEQIALSSYGVKKVDNQLKVVRYSESRYHMNKTRKGAY
jgi:osmotically-inducible protein OsmY